MPRIPKAQRTISQFIEAQLPDFVIDDYPKFAAFLKAYYEFLESNGTEVFECKIVSATQTTVVLTDSAATEQNSYVGMNIVALNGPTKGRTRKIKEYNAITRTIVTELPWGKDGVPLPNTRMAIRDTVYPGQLIDYRDIDTTLDRFVDFFRNEFMYQIPGNILADERNVIKKIKDFYQARGTENSFRFLFRILFNEEVEFYYPKVDLFRASDARWYVENVMRVTTTGDTFDYVNRELIGVYSGTTAKVESATQKTVGNSTVTELKLSNIDGTFQIDPETGLPEKVKIVYPVDPPPQSRLGHVDDLLEPSTAIKWEDAYQLLEKLLVQVPGNNYLVGETISITGGGALSTASAIITSIFETYYNGRCASPPAAYYIEPYFGHNDFVETTGDPLKDMVAIPGLYFWSDVRSDYTEVDLLNATEIQLSLNETTVEDFFAGDEIALVAGTGVNQKRTVIAYNGVTKVATVDEPFDPIPDGTTEYSIKHVRGGIKSVKIIDFGLGFVSTPTVTINSANGTGAVLPPILGLVGQTSGEWTPGRVGGVGGVATTTDSFPSANKIIQDSYYWQDFSYDLRVGLVVDEYRDVVKALLHPAGTKMFGTLLLKTKPETNFLETLQRYILQLDSKIFDSKIDVDGRQIIHVNTVDPKVIGTQNKDFDAMKFWAFQPTNIVYTQDEPGPTQINNFKDTVIGDIINFPERRNKINADAWIRIDTSSALSKVGPVGQTRATVAKFRFVGFPPYEGWESSAPGYDIFGNTSIEVFKDLPISEMIVSPKTKRANNCVDAHVGIFQNNGIPVIGNVVTYAFLQGMDSQIVYNVGPNSFGIYDAAVGSTVLTETEDPAWVAEGLTLTAADQDIVNATGIPLSLRDLTVIVVAVAPSVASDMTIVSCIPNDTINGFSIDLRAGGGLSFRVQYGGVSKTITFPAATVADGDYFMASLRFVDGLLSANVNNATATRAMFPSFPVSPTSNSDGWYFGQPSSDHLTVAQSPSNFGTSLYGGSLFLQPEMSASSASMDYFDGTLAYAMFYDRALYDYELDFVYDELKTQLATERSITLP